MQRRTALIGLSALALSACSAPVVWAPAADVARALAAPVGPPSLTLYTMKNTGSDNGAHSGLLINASQRVIFDPAGSFKINALPERNDVIFGMTPRMEAIYASYHARESYYVIAQEIEVSAAVAEQALSLALANGPVPKSGCTRAISKLMRQLPGFENIGTTYFPDNLFDDLAKIPAVQTTIIREDDEADRSVSDRLQSAATQAGQSQ